jgi:hypoxanthine phosphoribosyltransferase
MSDKELDIVDEVLDDTPSMDEAADEIQEASAKKEVKETDSAPAMPKTKAGMIQAMVDAMNGKKKDQLQASYDKIMSAMHDEDMHGDEEEEEVKPKLKKESRKVTREEVDLDKGNYNL